LARPRPQKFFGRHWPALAGSGVKTAALGANARQFGWRLSQSTAIRPTLPRRSPVCLVTFGIRRSLLHILVKHSILHLRA
jgi:hypothetical protein